MPRTHYDEVFDANGNLLDRRERVTPDPDPTPAERLAALEAALDAVSEAASFAEAKAAIKARRPVRAAGDRER